MHCPQCQHENAARMKFCGECGAPLSPTVLFETRAADGVNERLPALAAELVRLKVDIIVTSGSAAGQAARRATATIPIVMASGNPLRWVSSQAWAARAATSRASRRCPSS